MKIIATAILILITIPAPAQTIWADSVIASPGDTAWVSVFIEGLPDPGGISFQCSIEADSTVVSPVAVQDQMLTPLAVNLKYPEAGAVTLAWASPTPVDFSDTLFQVGFLIDPSAYVDTELRVRISGAMVGEEITPTPTDGIIFIEAHTDTSYRPTRVSEPVITVTDRIVYLDWTTFSEDGNSGFVISHARLGDDEFTVDKFIESQGASDLPQDYRYALEGLSDGTYLVRLLQVNYDGSSAIVATVEVSVGTGGPEGFTLAPLYPNPTSDVTRARLTLSVAGDLTMSVYDILGRKYHTETIVAPAGAHSLRIPSTDFPAGLYMVRFDWMGYSWTRMFTKL